MKKTKITLALATIMGCAFFASLSANEDTASEKVDATVEAVQETNDQISNAVEVTQETLENSAE